MNYAPENLWSYMRNTNFPAFIDENQKIHQQILAANLLLSKLFPNHELGLPILQTIIGDSMGEDWVSDFCSENEANKAMAILIEFGLTT